MMFLWGVAAFAATPVTLVEAGPCAGSAFEAAEAQAGNAHACANVDRVVRASVDRLPAGSEVQFGYTLPAGTELDYGSVQLTPRGAQPLGRFLPAGQTVTVGLAPPSASGGAHTATFSSLQPRAQYDISLDLTVRPDSARVATLAVWAAAEIKKDLTADCSALASSDTYASAFQGALEADDWEATSESVQAIGQAAAALANQKAAPACRARKAARDLQKEQALNQQKTEQAHSAQVAALPDQVVVVSSPLVQTSKGLEPAAVLLARKVDDKVWAAASANLTTRSPGEYAPWIAALDAKKTLSAKAASGLGTVALEIPQGTTWVRLGKGKAYTADSIAPLTTAAGYYPGARGELVALRDAISQALVTHGQVQAAATALTATEAKLGELEATLDTELAALFTAPTTAKHIEVANRRTGSVTALETQSAANWFVGTTGVMFWFADGQAHPALHLGTHIYFGPLERHATTSHLPRGRLLRSRTALALGAVRGVPSPPGGEVAPVVDLTATTGLYPTTGLSFLFRPYLTAEAGALWATHTSDNPLDASEQTRPQLYLSLGLDLAAKDFYTHVIQ